MLQRVARQLARRPNSWVTVADSQTDSAVGHSCAVPRTSERIDAAWASDS
jgi:hypothetical protein